MRRDDLHQELRAEYSEQKPWGVQKIDVDGYEHIYFVIPHPLPKDKDDIGKIPREKMNQSLTKAFTAINRQKSLIEMDGIDYLISRLIRRQEALSSSRIEGTYSTIDEVFSAESDLLPAEESTSKSDALSIVQYAKAMDIIFARISRAKEEGITLDLFCQIHKAIVTNDPNYSYIPGKLRSPGKPGSIVQIGGLRRKEESTYNPAPSHHVKRLMDEFVHWLSDPAIREEGDAGLGIPMPLRMAFAHAHFEAIHPFSDGNGRVGRLIWPIQMIMSDLAPIHISSFIEAEKDGYYMGLKAYQQKLDVIPLLDYIADALNLSQKEEEKTRSALRELPKKWALQVKLRAGSSAERILPLLLALPVIGAEEAASQLKVSLPAALAALERLSKVGILREITGKQRRKKWTAYEVLTILKRPFGMSPSEALELQRELK